MPNPRGQHFNRSYSLDRVRKAFDVLGEDPSRKKLLDTLGLHEYELELVLEANIERQEAFLSQLRERSNQDRRNKKHALKALGVLGHDPSKAKLLNHFGLSEQEMCDAKLRNFEKFELPYARARVTLDRKTRRTSGKAMTRLGHDPVTEKLSDVLGEDEDEVVLALQQVEEEAEQKVRRQRSNSDKRNRRDAQKALGVLGRDPSQVKANNMLGIDESAFAAATAENRERLEEGFVRVRWRSDRKRRRSSSKALDIMGSEPSIEKLEETLGVSADIVHVARQEVQEKLEAGIRQKRISGDRRNRRDSLKALLVLGLDPSADKALETLGIDTEDLHSAAAEAAEREEAEVRRQRFVAQKKERKQNRKALGVLGHDPSEEKAKELMGLCSEEWESAQLELQERCVRELEDERLRCEGSQLCRDRDERRKALEVLGVHPSETKVDRHFNIDPSTFKGAQCEALTRKRSGSLQLGQQPPPSTDVRVISKLQAAALPTPTAVGAAAASTTTSAGTSRAGDLVAHWHILAVATASALLLFVVFVQLSPRLLQLM